MKKVFFTISIIVPLLTSCSSNPITDIIRENLWVNAIQRVIYGYPDFPITRDMVENIPYASIRVKIGKGPAGLMILQKKEDNIYSWVSKDSVIFQIKKGRIIRTSGLTNDLIEYFFDNDLNFKKIIDDNLNKALPLEKKDSKYLRDLLNCPAKDASNCNRELLEGTTYLPITTRMISLSNPEVRALELIVKTAQMGTTKIEILDREYNVLLIKEITYNRKIDWISQNLFWVDPQTGKVRKSIQQIAPNLPPILIEVTKLPSE